MGSPYRQFCPVAKAMELLDERWTLLVVRELVAGSEHFNDLRRGLPRMSPGLLSKRLQQLARAGLVERRSENGEIRYLLTEAGRELGPVVEAVGAWGVRWVGEIGDQDLDPRLLMWDMHRNVDRSAVPETRTVVRFRFDDVPRPAREWWLVDPSRRGRRLRRRPGLPGGRHRPDAAALAHRGVDGGSHVGRGAADRRAGGPGSRGRPARPSRLVHALELRRRTPCPDCYTYSGYVRFGRYIGCDPPPTGQVSSPRAAGGGPAAKGELVTCCISGIALVVRRWPPRAR